MSDVPASATPPLPEKHEETVSYERFQLANKQAREAQEKEKAKDDQLKALTDRLEELEAQGQSETERERTQRERAEKQLADTQAELQAREARLTQMEKGGWLRNAASQAGFANPDDAVAFAEFDGLESERDADKAIKKLAEQRPYLLRQETPGQQLGQVLEGGRPQVPGQQAPDPKQEADQQLMGEIRQALGRGQTSVPGLLDE